MIKGSPAEIQTGYVLNREQGVTATCSVPERKLCGKHGKCQESGLKVCWRDSGYNSACSVLNDKCSLKAAEQ